MLHLLLILLLIGVIVMVIGWFGISQSNGDWL